MALKQAEDGLFDLLRAGSATALADSLDRLRATYGVPAPLFNLGSGPGTDAVSPAGLAFGPVADALPGSDDILVGMRRGLFWH